LPQRLGLDPFSGTPYTAPAISANPLRIRIEAHFMGDPSATVVQPVSAQSNSSIGESPDQLALAVRLGRATYRHVDVARLEAGATLVLDSMATEPVDVIVDGQLVARGEVLLVDGKYGVRICELIGRTPRKPRGEVIG
jgi:flagellar motor switch protein FliN/FliY